VRGSQNCHFFFLKNCNLLEGSHQGFGGWRVHEIEMDQIVDAQLLQLENDRPKIGSQDFGVGVLLHLVLVSLLGVESEAFPGLSSAGTAGALLSRGLRNGRNEKGLDSDSRVVDLLLRETW